MHGPRERALSVQTWRVVVIGAGNAGLVAAMAAHDAGARDILVLERSDETFRGGNSRHTRNIRSVHGADFPYNSGEYGSDELWSDLCGVGTGPSDRDLAWQTIKESESVSEWMLSHGARFQKPLAGTLHLGRTNTFFLGGGKALLNSYHRTIRGMDITVAYNVRVRDLIVEGDRCVEAVVDVAGVTSHIRGRSFVVAAGGFEANLDWLAQYWGEGAHNYIVRGPRTNDGLVLKSLLRHDAQIAGEPRGFHSVAVDARSPKFDGGIATRVDCIPFGVVLNSEGARFYDEGEEIWPKRYAIWGGQIALQPGQIAYALWDSKVNRLFLPPMFGVTSGRTVGEVATALGFDGDIAEKTVNDFNESVPAGAHDFDPRDKDGVATVGLTPPKSNWAQPLDKPPYYGVALRPGVTFTYMGVRIDSAAHVQRTIGKFANVLAAGEVMSGNVLSSGYLAGFGMCIGTVWGRIAGEGAARVAA
jgi:tricarballylate dehydrogenase